MCTKTTVFQPPRMSVCWSIVTLCQRFGLCALCCRDRRLRPRGLLDFLSRGVPFRAPCQFACHGQTDTGAHGTSRLLLCHSYLSLRGYDSLCDSRDDAHSSGQVKAKLSRPSTLHSRLFAWAHVSKTHRVSHTRKGCDLSVGGAAGCASGNDETHRRLERLVKVWFRMEAVGASSRV